MIYIVDTSSVEHIEAKNYDLYLIEGNYESEEQIEKEIEEHNKKHEYTHLYRVRETHLSQVKALNWLDKNMGDNSEYCFIHQHVERGGDNEQGDKR